MKTAIISFFAIVFSMTLVAGPDSADAIIRLLNSRSAGSPRKFNEAARAVYKEAEKGRPLQQYVMALVADDKMLPRDLQLSKEKRNEYFAASGGKIQALAEKKGNALAWYLLSLQNNDETMLKRAADGNNVQALNAWGILNLNKALSNKDLSQKELEAALGDSFRCFKRAAGMKDGNGYYNLGMCYLHGWGTEQKLSIALDCFRSAAEQSHSEAINNIGGFFRDGIVVARDKAMAAKWFEKSAKLQNAYGELNYALALQRGEGVEVDEKRAVQLLEDSSAKGCVEALNALGMCYYEGSGVEKNLRKAFELYETAAKAGYATSMENLAVCYDSGAGVEKDAGQAMIWKVRARAARGDRNAIAWLTQNGHTLK